MKLGTMTVIVGLLIATNMVRTCGLPLKENCVRTERYVDGKCESCPQCAPGFGLPQECGHGRGAGLRCEPCAHGFYNPTPGSGRCSTCTNCSSFHREMTYQCRPVIDAQCGACEPGYFDQFEGLNFLYPCTPSREKRQKADAKNQQKDVAPSSDQTSYLWLIGSVSLILVISLAIFLIRRYFSELGNIGLLPLSSCAGRCQNKPHCVDESQHEPETSHGSSPRLAKQEAESKSPLSEKGGEVEEPSDRDHLLEDPQKQVLSESKKGDYQLPRACPLPAKHQPATDVTTMIPSCANFPRLDVDGEKTGLRFSQVIGEASTLLNHSVSCPYLSAGSHDGLAEMADQQPENMPVKRHAQSIPLQANLVEVLSSVSTPTEHSPSSNTNGDTTLITDTSRDSITETNQSRASSFSDVHSIATYPAIGPVPRRLASLGKNFTKSRGDVAHCAEVETEKVSHKFESLDERDYTQALKLANGHLVAELDFDMMDDLNTELKPRCLAGDRNFQHVGRALGVQPEALNSLNTFKEVHVHLCRQRVTLSNLLQAMRKLGRLDIVHRLSSWIYSNLSPLSSLGGDTDPLPQRPLSHIVLPETQGPLPEDDGTRGLPIQESGCPRNEYCFS